MTTIDWTAELPCAMDDATRHLKNGEVVAAFKILGNEMTGIWNKAYEQGQIDRAIGIVKEHELFSIVQQDPYSSRAYQKPRGYAGDAVMMDYVYAGIPNDDVSELGKAVFTGTTRGSMGLSVLFRRQLLTAHINEVASSRSDFKILSVASGHCREIENSLLANSEFTDSGKLVAFDQDAESCDTVRRDYNQYPIEVVCANIRKLLAGGEKSMGKFDLIYSAGLFDYLTDVMAKKLTATMMTMLKPRGKLLIGNFAPSCIGRGYLELFLDWKLTYRNANQLSSLFGKECIEDTRSFLDPHGNVVYSEWTCPLRH
jgi:hypothetical protein